MSETNYKEEFERFLSARKAHEPAWLQSIRETAFRRFTDLGMPTRKHEDWKYTPVSFYTDVPFAQAETPTQAPALADIEAQTGALSGLRAIFVDGHFHSELSDLSATTEGVHIGSVADALKEDSSVLKQELQRHVDRNTGRVFEALNLAFFVDGLFVHAPKNTKLEQTLHVVNVSSGTKGASVQQPRNVFVAEQGAQLDIVESYIGLHDGLYWTNAVTEVDVADNAHVTHLRIQEEGKDGRHIASLHAHLSRASNSANHIVSFGGKAVRNDTEAVLSAENAECTLNGLYLSGDNQHVDNRTSLDHARPHCNSYQLYKGVLTEKGKGVFNGHILVRQAAQKTDAKQSNQALLLSDDAMIYSKPQLEIFADDVRCTHGATSGNLDPEGLFYLQSRGVHKDAAKALMTYAFANELLTQLSNEEIRERLEQRLSSRLHTAS